MVSYFVKLQKQECKKETQKHQQDQVMKPTVDEIIVSKVTFFDVCSLQKTYRQFIMLIGKTTSSLENTFRRSLVVVDIRLHIVFFFDTLYKTSLQAT